MKKLFIFVVLSAISTSAFADLYGAFSLGRTNNVDLSDAGTAIGGSLSLMLGFDVNQYWAAEIGYTSLLTNAGSASANSTQSITLNGQEIAGIGKWPINEQIYLYGRVGYAFMSSSTATTKNNTDGSTTNGNNTSAPSGFVWGPGVNYKIDDKLDLRAGYNIYMLRGSNTGAQSITGVPSGSATCSGYTSCSGGLSGSGDILASNAYLTAAFHF